MAELILRIYKNEGDTLLMPLETAICLNIIDYTRSRLDVILVQDKNVPPNSYIVRYKMSAGNHKSARLEELGGKTLYTTLPTLIMDDGISFVAGLAAVMRQIVRCSEKRVLLGFRECCLAAPAEVSSWTRFIEVDIVHCMQHILDSPQYAKILYGNVGSRVSSVKDSGENVTYNGICVETDKQYDFCESFKSAGTISDNSPSSESILNSNRVLKSCNSPGDVDLSSTHYNLPEEIATLEYHLSIPAKVHNRGKYGEGGPSHDYVEGPHMVVSDLVIATCVHLILDFLCAYKTEVIPFTLKWLNRVNTDAEFQIYLSKVQNVSKLKPGNNWLLPILKNPVDLYKKESKKKLFTQGDLLSTSLKTISDVALMEYRQLFDTSDLEICDVLPDVPKERLLRKTQQLTNLAKAALQVAKDGDLVVDLCCGSGHLGILLATLLPSCTIILLDNKEMSLERAIQRVQEMKLTNVQVVQSNLDYFSGKFQVGVSLHACGIASDIVIKKCLNSNAHLVLCPCCYGGIQRNHIVKYPQSSTFQDTGLCEHDFFVLAHNADTCDTDQGHLAMRAVDTDRCMFLTEHGYLVSLSKLQPLDCTTRNNLIVAVYG